MKELLQFLSEHLAYLFDYFRLVDSRATSSFGGNAYVVLESANTRIRLVQERMRLFIEFQSVHGAPTEWYAWDVVRGFILNRDFEQSQLDASGSVQLKEIMPRIETAFSASRREFSEKKLDELERKRSKRLFGV